MDIISVCRCMSGLFMQLQHVEGVPSIYVLLVKSADLMNR